MRTIVVARTALFLLACITAMQAQQSQPQTTPVATVPRLVRVSNTFHPANGQPAAPLESVTFSIYREESGGAPLWQETQNVAVDAEGHYTALMGSTQNEGVSLELFSSGEPRWMGVRFNRPGEAEQPRVQLASVPYALKASDAETLGGRPASAYLLDPNAASGSSATAIVGTSPVAASEPLSPGRLKPRTTSGTTNCIAVFTDATDLGCSPMWQSGNNIGIGTHTPAAPLQVVGTANPAVLIDTYGNSTNLRQRRADGTPASPAGVKLGDIIGNTSFTGYGTTGFLASGSAAIKGIAAENFSDAQGGGILTFNTMTGGTTNLIERMRLDQNGNVGIGTTAPGFRLDVEGGTINGNNPATAGFAPGVAGTSASANSAAVSGFNSYTAGGMNTFPTGVSGSVNGPTGAGVAGNAQMAGASGVNGFNSATSGFAPGVAGTSASANGAGVSGFNQYTAGAMGSYPTGVSGGVNGPTGAGVAGNAGMAGAVGVSGFNGATSGFAVGVAGGTASNNGAGVQGNASQAGAVAVGGYNNATSGYAVGVEGGTGSNAGAGVAGNAGAGAFGVSGFNGGTSGYGVGTQGASSSPQGIGVLAVDWACGGSGCTLVPGTAAQFQTATTGILLQGLSGAAGANTGTASPVFLIDGLGDASFSGWLQANSSTAASAAVTGNNTSTSGFAIGVQGTNNSTGGGGVLGVANKAGAWGVQGSSNATSGGGVGVFAEAGSPNGAALLAQSQICGPSSCTLVSGTAASLETSTSGVLLVGTSGAPGASNGSATQVLLVDGQGNLTIAGNLTAKMKSFKIDDPIDPEHKSLSHASIESSEMINIYSGNVILDGKGAATVTMPAWLEALNGDFRYQLTTIGGNAREYIAKEIHNGQFKIAGGRPRMKVSWQVTGVRHDAWALAHPMQVEETKTAPEAPATAHIIPAVTPAQGAGH